MRDPVLRMVAGLALLCLCLACSSATAPGPQPCVSDPDCPGGLECIDGYCQQPCMTSADCPDGQQCVSGVCHTPCQDDSQCADGERCRDGFCRPAEPTDGGDGDGGNQCQDADGDGYGPGCPAGPDCDDEDPSANPGAEEKCADGKDNDCDGETDEPDCGCTPGEVVSCYQGPAGTEGVGICSAGHATCRGDRSWGECLGQVLPEDAESCDGRDEDCDGDTDEEVSNPGFCSSLGVCAGTEAVCEDGTWQCPYPPEYQVPDTTCDGIDNDCDGVPDSGIDCAGTCCRSGQICRFDACIADQGGCSSDADCQEDSYCQDGDCLPYGVGPRGDDGSNPECTRLIFAGLFQPSLQCQWLGPPAGDPYPNHLQVLGTPVVVDFDFDGDPATVRPSIVFNSYDGLDGDSGVVTTLDGVLRIIDGATCETQFSLGPYLNGCNPPAAADLDGDGRPEIVAHLNNGGVIAYRYDAASGSWQTLWTGHDSNGAPVTFSEGATGWGGPSIADLDDDGSPEVLSGGLVYDAGGLLVDSSLGLAVLWRIGFPAAADLDADGRVELAGGVALWEFDPAGRRWVQEWGGAGNGYTAVADFGTFGADPAGDDRTVLDGIAEIAVVANGSARIDNVLGRTVFGPYSLPSSSGGGPPTIGDFDGDGRAELAAAASDSYTVFDPDCRGAPDPAFCPTGRSDGILWTQPSQDHSSNITGSSLFDFEGDGSVEAVYADECFVRVYDGKNGRVLYSQWRSSCTWNENPVVADTDGDYAAELVVPANESCGTSPDLVDGMGGLPYDTSPGGLPMDPLFAGLPCNDDGDCLSGNCDAGLCRCSGDAECGGATDGFVCAPPPAGTPGSGSTCRAEWRGSMHGIRVYRDALDRWVGSRTIWNQHAYAVTNINEDGTVPRTSQAQLNWQVAGLNNFRQNVQGDLHPEYSPDTTAGQGVFSADCPGGVLTLTVRICNRGTSPIAAGVNVGFFDGDPDQGGTLVCSATTSGDLQPGQCQDVSCAWADAPTDQGHDIVVVSDYDGQRNECLEENNRAYIPGAICRLQ